ncbi:MAG: acyl-CoA/acyl-ACP dehydrogenase [Myxococcales bacterium]|nr:acyl-CoA/acyl-ACP dehydrogenase [Myxococcales bacterium]
MKRPPDLVEPSHPLHPTQAFRRLPLAARPFVRLDSLAVWESDTRSLPPALGEYRRQLRRFAEEVLLPRRDDGDSNQHGSVQSEVLEAAARAGLLSDLLPRPIGTTPLRRMRHSLVFQQSLKMEELCAACAGLGLLIGAHGLGTMPLILSTDLALLRRELWPLYRANAGGRPRLLAYAITEPGGGSDVEDADGARRYKPGCVARRVPGGYRLNGRKIFISGGDLAHAVTVFGALEGEGMESWTCFLVYHDAPGFSRVRNEIKMGQRASAATELLFEEVFVPDARVVGPLRAGWALNRATLNISRVPVGAIALGIARGAFEAALGFVNRHSLAGRPLIHYQEVQLRLAQMQIDTSAMRGLLWQVSRSWAPTQTQAATVKVFCSDTAVGVCRAAMDLMANHGASYAGAVEKSYRDARLTQIYEGTNQINRLAVVEDQLEAWLALG